MIKNWLKKASQRQKNYQGDKERSSRLQILYALVDA